MPPEGPGLSPGTEGAGIAPQVPGPARQRAPGWRRAEPDDTGGGLDVALGLEGERRRIRWPGAAWMAALKTGEG